MEIEQFFTCPHCWQKISVVLDLSSPDQSYIEDCEVCCNPILIRFLVRDGEVVEFVATRAQD